MKLNIACPSTGAQKFLEIDDEKKLRALYDRRISQEVDGEALGEEFAGYVFRITGGNDKQGFPMKQGVLCNHRVRLLLRAGAPERRGEARRHRARRRRGRWHRGVVAPGSAWHRGRWHLGRWLGVLAFADEVLLLQVLSCLDRTHRRLQRGARACPRMR